jgi:hypothetical protein
MQPTFREKSNYPVFSAYPDGSRSQVIRIIGVILFTVYLLQIYYFFKTRTYFFQTFWLLNLSYQVITLYSDSLKILLCIFYMTPMAATLNS